MEIKNPELYTWKVDWDEWTKKFIHPQTQNKDWDAIVEEVGPEIYIWPIFTEKFCELIIEEAEHRDIWTVNRHENYPTTDFLLKKIGLNGMYEKVLQEYGYPVANSLWGLTGKAWGEEMTSENFLAKYNPDAQGHLDSHIDMSDYTITLALNEAFEGGGTWYHKQQTLVKAPTGHVCLFPMPTHKHSGRWIKSGTRYIIVSFCKRRR
tara:strand:+ start:478 stop:1098 length:621 start_codon:yes stop_codon:yes gene_type:complete